MASFVPRCVPPAAGNRWNTLAAALALLVLVTPARAHRLDEYLQATRIAVSSDRIQLRIDLTPGAAILPQLLPKTDLDGNGRFSRKERTAYGQLVLRDLHLELDGHRIELRLDHVDFPPRADMMAGEGVLRLILVSKIPKLTPGHHELVFRNNHLPEISVYLVNALQPADKRLSITRQVRDQTQKEYRLEFEVSSGKAESSEFRGLSSSD